jgi:hypothetical protein
MDNSHSCIQTLDLSASLRIILQAVDKAEIAKGKSGAGRGK